jgi:hypothetical protein
VRISFEILNLLCQIRLVHIKWLSEIGQQLERRCEFASALKYYYTGKVYYSKLDNFGSLPRGTDSKSIVTSFQTNPDGLYETMFEALQQVANSKEYEDWAKKHWASWATDEQKQSHLKACLNLCVSDEDPRRRLQTVRFAERAHFRATTQACLSVDFTFQVLENAAKHLCIFFHFRLLPGAARSSDPHVLLTHSTCDSTFGFACPPIALEEEQAHAKLRKQFEQLFERLLPHSNKEVSRGCYLFVH